MSSKRIIQCIINSSFNQNTLHQTDNAGNNFTSNLYGARPGSGRMGTESVPSQVQEPFKEVDRGRERSVPSSNVKYSVRMKASELDVSTNGVAL